MSNVKHFQVFVGQDNGHKSERKVRIKITGIRGSIWVSEGEDYESIALKWITEMTGLPTDRILIRMTQVA